MTDLKQDTWYTCHEEQKEVKEREPCAFEMMNLPQRKFLK